MTVAMQSNSPGSVFYHSDAPRAALRVAVLLDCLGVPAYALQILHDLRSASYVADVVLHVVRGGPPVPRRGLIAGIGTKILSAFDRIYGFVHSPDLIQEIPSGLPASSIKQLQSAADFRAEGFDVLLDLRRLCWGRDVLEIPHLGVWWLHGGRRPEDDKWPAFAREIIGGRPGRFVQLLRRMPGAEVEFVLRALEFSGSPFPSCLANQIDVFSGCGHLVIQTLWELHRMGPAFVVQRCKPLDQTGFLPSPTVLGLVRWIVGYGLGRIRNRLGTRAKAVAWRVAVRRAVRPLLFEGAVVDLSSFRWLDVPEGHFWADPFLFAHAGKVWLFFEEMPASSDRAHISCGYLDAEGQLHDVRAVLRLPTHLSYPLLVRSGDDIYMLPESSEAGGVDLYRATEFPDKWERVSRLLEFPCVDSTVFTHEGSWWMFTSPMAVPGHAPETWVFRASDLTGPWVYQTSSPLSSSASTARGAGNVFAHVGRLIRPSQDCLQSYGRGLNFHSVDGVEKDNCTEQWVQSLNRNGELGFAGIHHYNFAGDWEVIDVLLPVKRSLKHS